MPTRLHLALPQLTRRQFNASALVGSLVAALPGGGRTLSASVPPSQPTADVIVSVPGLAADSPLSKALSDLTSGVDGLAVDVTREAPVWDVVVVPSQAPLPPGMLDLQPTPLPGVVARRPGSPVGRVQNDPSADRVTIATAKPAVFVRTDVIEDQGYAAPANLEDLVALVLAVAYGSRHRYGFTAAPDTTAWAELAASFVTNLSAYGQRDLIAEQLTTGYDLLGSLAKQAAPPDLASYTREQAVAAFCAGESAVLLDDALLAAEILEGAADAGFSVSTFPIPMGPAGRPDLLLPGLDVAISSATSDVGAASAVARDLLSGATQQTQVQAATSPLPAISTEGGRALATPVHSEPGSARTDAIHEAAVLLSR